MLGAMGLKIDWKAENLKFMMKMDNGNSNSAPFFHTMRSKGGSTGQ
jgi:hypothetical protein